jgi:predicted peptidase
MVTKGAGYYFVCSPPTDRARPYPVVMALHGDEGSPDAAIITYWEDLWTTRQDFILIMPKCPTLEGSWYADGHEGHVAYINDILAEVASKYNMDIDRMYATGYSGGSEWLSMHGFQYQDVFAAIQWNCGGFDPSGYYTPPPKPECKVDVRIYIADDDFLVDGARELYATAKALGHQAEYVTAPCSGHCCGHGFETSNQMLGWFLQRTKCDSSAGTGCGNIRDVP